MLTIGVAHYTRRSISQTYKIISILFNDSYFNQNTRLTQTEFSTESYNLKFVMKSHDESIFLKLSDKYAESLVE